MTNTKNYIIIFGWLFELDASNSICSGLFKLNHVFEYINIEGKKYAKDDCKL